MAMTPADQPSSPSNYAAVTPHGDGTSWYDIQASQQDLTAVVTAANDLTGAGVLYPMGPRQQEARAFMESPMGYGDFDVMSGYTGSWGSVPEPDVDGP